MIVLIRNKQVYLSGANEKKIPRKENSPVCMSEDMINFRDNNVPGSKFCGIF